MRQDRTGSGAWIGTVVSLLALTVAGCGPGSAERDAALAAAEREAAAVVATNVDSADAILSRQQGLTPNERSQLRKYLNEEQVAMARTLGVDPVADSGAIRRLVKAGSLVPLEDSTEHWVVRDLTHSVPYVTPDAREMLVDVGRRFHARLDSLGLPLFRFEVTSVLRTGAMQASLRRGNANASRTTSSHEFGTTVDLAYQVFAPPADPVALQQIQIPDTLGVSAGQRAELERRIQVRAEAALRELGEERAAALKAILGQVLAEMQEEGLVQPLMERSQAVYHMTVAARYGDARDGAEVAE